jgi:hypothetical protein
MRFGLREADFVRLIDSFADLMMPKIKKKFSRFSIQSYVAISSKRNQVTFHRRE